MARDDDAAGSRRMLEDIVVPTMPNNPPLSFQPGNNSAPVCLEGRFGHQGLRLCAIICALSWSLSTAASADRMEETISACGGQTRNPVSPAMQFHRTAGSDGSRSKWPRHEASVRC